MGVCLTWGSVQDATPWECSRQRLYGNQSRVKLLLNLVFQYMNVQAYWLSWETGKSLISCFWWEVKSLWWITMLPFHQGPHCFGSRWGQSDMIYIERQSNASRAIKSGYIQAWNVPWMKELGCTCNPIHKVAMNIVLWAKVGKLWSPRLQWWLCKHLGVQDKETASDMVVGMNFLPPAWPKQDLIQQWIWSRQSPRTDEPCSDFQKLAASTYTIDFPISSLKNSVDCHVTWGTSRRTGAALH